MGGGGDRDRIEASGSLPSSAIEVMLDSETIPIPISISISTDPSSVPTDTELELVISGVIGSADPSEVESLLLTADWSLVDSVDSVLLDGMLVVVLLVVVLKSVAADSMDEWLIMGTSGDVWLLIGWDSEVALGGIWIWISLLLDAETETIAVIVFVESMGKVVFEIVVVLLVRSTERDAVEVALRVVDKSVVVVASE
mmetsp:Transcript_41967/g.50858  ORF Transcript_41967/g.50858 Transcript_41967/m.50858 type:complete len:198 (-) Transcript_41967:493-1086(-)